MQKNALVTGANSGIGFAAAQQLQQLGVDVTITGRNAAALQQAAEQLSVAYCVLDLTDTTQFAQLTERFQQEGLDYLVNNAGMAQLCPLELHSAEFWQTTLQTNLTAPMLLIQQLLPALIKRKGAVCNVSSAIVNNAGLNMSAYAASKGGLEAMTRNLALELAPQGVRVNCVAPGAIATPIFDKIGLPEAQKDAVMEGLAQTIPMKRYGTPEEVAQVIVAQLQATYVTGAVWSVDGGVDVT